MTVATDAARDDVLRCWFEEAGPARWFAVDPTFDAHLRARFGDLHARVAACEAWGWRATPDGRLAEIIVLDQLSRNLFRGQARAFACDALALALAQGAVAVGAERALAPDRRAFLLLPFMHSESLVIHAAAEAYFAAPGLEHNLAYLRRHTDVLRRFGRYPQRNAALGRASTAAELTALADGDAAF